MKFKEEDFESYKKEISSQGNILVRVVTDSMEPLIKVNEKFIVERIDNLEALKRFDIIIFLLEGKLLAHFYWGRSFMNSDLMFKSLKEITSFDLPVPSDHVLGKVKLDFPYIFKLKVYISLALKRFR